MLIVIDKCTHEEQLSQPLQTYKKQFKLAVTFLSGYNGFFSSTGKKNQIYFKISIFDAEFTQTNILPDAYKIESLNDEVKRNIIEDGYFTETNYSFKIKTIFQL